MVLSMSHCSSKGAIFRLAHAMISAMQITVDISEDFAARAAEMGLSPEAYAQELLGMGYPGDSEWEAEAPRRAGEIDAGRGQLVPWEAIEARLRSFAVA